jgi:exosortase
LLHWALALEVVGLTLLWLHFGLRYSGSGLRTSDFAFPICYFLVAVPWLRPIEGPLIESLTRANVAVTIELLGLVGIPAMQHGNVIEVSTGVVGIDDACSGIRSFQATLMISLFLGELYALSAMRRALLVLAGFVLSFIFNVGRTGLLTWVAARDGVDAIGKWHDPAGIAILVGCFTGLWAVGVWMKKGSTVASPDIPPFPPRSISAFSLQPSAFSLTSVSLALGAWFLLVEGGTEAWFRSHETGQQQTIQWSGRPPPANPSVRQLPVAEATRDALRYTTGGKWAWSEADETLWQMIYLYWSPGRLWVKSVTSHSPHGCLSAVGWKLTADRGIREFETGQLKLGFRAYTFEANGDRVQVFFCLWEDGAKVQPMFTRRLTQWDRLRSALEGRRNPGMRSLEIAVWGAKDQGEAEAVLQRQLANLIVVEQGSGAKTEK